jgi:hypothetical protein
MSFQIRKAEYAFSTVLNKPENPGDIGGAKTQKSFAVIQRLPERAPKPDPFEIVGPEIRIALECESNVYLGEVIRNTAKIEVLDSKLDLAAKRREREQVEADAVAEEELAACRDMLRMGYVESCHQIARIDRSTEHEAARLSELEIKARARETAIAECAYVREHARRAMCDYRK